MSTIAKLCWVAENNGLIIEVGNLKLFNNWLLSRQHNSLIKSTHSLSSSPWLSYTVTNIFMDFFLYSYSNNKSQIEIGLTFLTRQRAFTLKTRFLCPPPFHSLSFVCGSESYIDQQTIESLRTFCIKCIHIIQVQNSKNKLTSLPSTIL